MSNTFVNDTLVKPYFFGVIRYKSFQNEWLFCNLDIIWVLYKFRILKKLLDKLGEPFNQSNNTVILILFSILNSELFTFPNILDTNCVLKLDNSTS